MDDKKVMTIKEFRHIFISELNTLYPVTEINTFFSWLCEHFLKIKKSEIPLLLNQELSNTQYKELNSALNQLKKNKPIQYILGETLFFGLVFKVSPFVLIPRPETEELVAWVLSETTINNPIVLDIGSGSGCIAITVAKHLKNAQVTAIDISKNALQWCLKNAILNHVKINTLQKDILKVKRLPLKYDLIISNPPYVKNSEKKLMNDNVVCYEPSIALYVSDNDPLIFYQKIAKLAFTHLTQNGLLFFEINENYGQEILKLLIDLGFKNVHIKKDIYGKDRMIKASR